MNPEDQRIRDLLAGLRQAPVPEPPLIEAAPAEPMRPALGLPAAAAVMLLALVGLLYWAPSRPRGAPGTVPDRISGVEAKLPLVEHEELRALLQREIELLRKELQLAQTGR